MDEAHSSQSGEAATEMKGVLAAHAIAEQATEEAEEKALAVSSGTRRSLFGGGFPSDEILSAIDRFLKSLSSNFVQRSAARFVQIKPG